MRREQMTDRHTWVYLELVRAYALFVPFILPCRCSSRVCCCLGKALDERATGELNVGMTGRASPANDAIVVLGRSGDAIRSQITYRAECLMYLVGGKRKGR